MQRRSLLRRAALALAASALAGAAQAAEVRVVSSGGFAAAYRALAPAFERATGHTLVTGWGPSMGQTVDAVPARLARGEPVDVLIMVGDALGRLVEQGTVAADSRADLARSGIGVVVRAGAPRPDIASADALRRALLAAKSIAYSDSASGVYIEREMCAVVALKSRVERRYFQPGFLEYPVVVWLTGRGNPVWDHSMPEKPLVGRSCVTPWRRD